jgi:hypothetical protein
MQRELKYFAYGSNMHLFRLWQRVPSSAVIEAVELRGHVLRFHKRSPDGSGKCNILRTGLETDRVIGILYRIVAWERQLLDQAEGLGSGYDHAVLSVRGPSGGHRAFAYIADPHYIDDTLKPYGWYKALVLTGARAHGLPADYVSGIERFEALEDPDEARHREHLRILAGRVPAR